MAVPFAYPQSIHRRRLNPPAYRTNESFKPVLREEFGPWCVYCRQPETLGGTFGVDHYKPVKIAPELQWVYGNLFFCCAHCNSHKREFWPSAAEINAGYVIPNPCDHTMFEHLRAKQGEVEIRSPAGQCASDVLDLNDPALVAFRRDFLKLFETTEKAVAEASRTIRDLESQLHRSRDASLRGELEGRLNAAMGELDVLRRAQARITGEP